MRYASALVLIHTGQLDSYVPKNSTYCGFTDPKGYETWSMAILRVGSLFLPSAIIVVFTVLILIYLHRAKKLRLAQLEGQGQGQLANKKSAASNVDLQLTIMLVSVAIAFIVLRLPYTVTYYLNTYKKELFVPLDIWLSYRIYLANKVCDMIAISNYAVNFFLYCLCGSSFRNRLERLVTCGKMCGKGSSGAGPSTASSNLSTSKYSQNKARVYTVSNGK